MKYVCEGGICRIIEETPDVVTNVVEAAKVRVAQGYMGADDFLAFLNGGAVDPSAAGAFGEWSWAVLPLVLLGGLAMNLTPCVLPMIPINLMVIGRSVGRGLLYGLGMALAYGALGVAAALSSLAFGTIQGNPYFNLAIGVLFVLLALALSGVFAIDFTKGRAGLAEKKSKMLPGLFAFFMGLVSAVLAGACVAPILISVLLLTAKLYAEGHTLAVALPFILGLGMALPWPFLGAGLKVLPKPGAWMKWVNRVFAIVVLLFAVRYFSLAVRGFAGSVPSASLTPRDFPSALERAKRPVLVDCGASWCKNCAAMERDVLSQPKVKEELEKFTVLKLQIEDFSELKVIDDFPKLKGLPAYLIYE